MSKRSGSNLKCIGSMLLCKLWPNFTHSFINDELLLTREKLNKKLVLFSKCTLEMKEQHPLRIESLYNILSTRNERSRAPGSNFSLSFATNAHWVNNRSKQLIIYVLFLGVSPLWLGNNHM